MKRKTQQANQRGSQPTPPTQTTRQLINTYIKLGAVHDLVIAASLTQYPLSTEDIHRAVDDGYYTGKRKEQYMWLKDIPEILENAKPIPPCIVDALFFAVADYSPQWAIDIAHRCGKKLHYYRYLLKMLEEEGCGDDDDLYLEFLKVAHRFPQAMRERLVECCLTWGNVQIAKKAAHVAGRTLTKQEAERLITENTSCVHIMDDALAAARLAGRHLHPDEVASVIEYYIESDGIAGAVKEARKANYQLTEREITCALRAAQNLQKQLSTS